MLTRITSTLGKVRSLLSVVASQSFLIILLAFLPFTHSFASVFTVNNTTDSNPFSFRNCIALANSSPGLDTVNFSVAGTISTLTPLPAITDPVFINGASAPGYVACGNPQISINGAGAGTANGIQLLSGASGSTIVALNVRSFALNGIQLINSDGNTIRSCYVGTTQNGNAPAPNGLNGFQLEVNSDFNVLGGPGLCDGNVVSGNGGAGFSLNSSSSNTIVGNQVGVNPAGTAAVGNSGIGVLMINGSNANVLGGNTLNERNIIANNGTGLTSNGISIDGSSGSIIQNNYIGVDATGNVAMGNAENGISLNNAPNSVIGGAGALEGNVIADHNFHGIVLNGGSNNVNIQGNVIGTNAAGTVGIGNDDSGVIVINSSAVNIGGTAAGTGNLLSGSISEYGIFVIGSSDVVVQGNRIGTDITGTAPIPNFDGGIRIQFNSSDNTVGGTAAGAGNVIAYNTGYGVGVLSSDCSRNLISRNEMFCNTGKGIELNAVGNNNHPSPVITSFSGAGASGTAQPNDIVELYYDSVCTATCQGKDFIASVVANGAGAWSYVGPLNGSATLVAIAIRTSLPPTLVNNTSEATCQVILPVEWAYFDASPEGGNRVRLDWETASETNASHFEVERSRDNLEFARIGRVDAANLGQGSRYDMLDTSPGGGMNFYRLKQVDFNGDFSYSEVRQVLLDADGVQLLLGANPADDVIRFQVQGVDQLLSVGQQQGAGQLQGAETVGTRFTLLDQVGKVVLTGERNFQSGEWIEIPASDLGAGLYLLRVMTSEGKVTRKVVVQH